MRAARRGVGEVDLRWGVTDEQKAEGAVLPICLAEIELSRPYFIGLLGERYGWVPDEIAGGARDQQPAGWRRRRPLGDRAGDPPRRPQRPAAMAARRYFYLRDPALG